MALRLPVLSRVSKKDEIESWVTKNAGTASQNVIPHIEPSHSRQLEIKQPKEETGSNASRSTKGKEEEGEKKEEGEGETKEEHSASASDYDEEEETVAEEPEVTSPAVMTYRRAAKRLGVIPLRKVLSEFGKDRMSFRNLTLTSRDMKATCTALLREREVVELDFSGNYIGGRECDYLVCVLSRNDYIEILDISNNCLSGRAMRSLSTYVCDNDSLTFLDISGNKLIDSDAQAVANFLTVNNSLRTLVMNHNEFREAGGRLIGTALGKNRNLVELELRWNHIRRDGAIGIAKGLEENKSLKRVDLAWNGFGFEGCVALSDALGRNHVLEDLDISSNRINPQALMELIRGLARNKALKALRIGQNPITASFTCVLLSTIRKNPAMALDHLDMEGIVVDRDFQDILDEIRLTRPLHVNYDLILPVKAITREEMLRRIQAPGAYNLDPLHMFFLLKEKMRASDFFHKINKDNDNGVSRDELKLLFQEAGIPVTGSVIDAIVEFMDADGDGTIDLAEFMTGDKKMRKMARQTKPGHKQGERSGLKAKKGTAAGRQEADNYSKYSRTFKKAEIDPVTLSVKVSRPASENLTSGPAGKVATLDGVTEEEEKKEKEDGGGGGWGGINKD